MDIPGIETYRVARTRDDLRLVPGETLLAGGTWLMSEPQPATTGFVDLTGLDWAEVEVSAAGLRIGATCTIARLLAWAHGRAADLPPTPPDWTALDLVSVAANALLASFKIWNTATVGGNICRSFAAGAMISFAATLDAVAVIWTPDGGERRLPVADLPTGNGTNVLAPGDVLRAIEIPAATLRSRAVLHRIALAELGRSGAVVSGRIDPDGTCLIVITAATATPVVLRLEAVPARAALASKVEAAKGYYTDSLGAADWRRGVSIVLAERVRADLLALSEHQEAAA